MSSWHKPQPFWSTHCDRCWLVLSLCHQNIPFKYLFDLRTALSQEKIHSENLVAFLLVHGRCTYTHHMHTYLPCSIMEQAKDIVFFPFHSHHLCLTISNVEASTEHSGDDSCMKLLINSEWETGVQIQKHARKDQTVRVKTPRTFPFLQLQA